MTKQFAFEQTVLSPFLRLRSFSILVAAGSLFLSSLLLLLKWPLRSVEPVLMGLSRLSFHSVAPFFSFCRAFLMLLSKLFAPVETPFFLSVKNRLLKVCKKFGRVVFIHYFRWRKDK